jgi:hypothetical protein
VISSPTDTISINVDMAIMDSLGTSPSAFSKTPADAWCEAMQREDFARAWAIADKTLLPETGFRKHTGPRHLQRIWRGEPLAGRRVLVRCYHGLGDTLQFCRFLAPLRAIAREVILWCQPELIPLLSDIAGADRVIPLHDGTPDVAYDVDIEIMELAHALRATRAAISDSVPYLTLDRLSRNERVRIPSPRMNRHTDRRYYAVGVVWQPGNWDQRRSIPVQTLKLLQRPGMRMYSLQRGASPDDLQALGAEDASASRIVALATAIRSLDLLVTIDSMPAHLAGAMGANVWTLLHADCDWRWRRDASHTAWYPTMRLFHQRTAGDWHGVMAAVGTALDRLAPTA